MAILWLSLLLISFLGYCLLVRRTLNVPAEFTPFFVVSTLMVVLYVLGYISAMDYTGIFPVGFNKTSVPDFPILPFGSLAIFGLGLVAAVVAAVRLPQFVVAEIRRPVLLTFFGLAVVAYFMLAGRYLYGWDEFSHWGLLPKCLYFCNTFVSPSDTAILFPTYIPGTGLFQYYVLKVFGVYSEGLLYFATILMISAATLSLTYGESSRKGQVIAWICCMSIISALAFQSGWIALHVDLLLALWFGAILFIYVAQSINKVSLVQRLICVIPGLAALVLIKHTGLIFCYVVVGMILLDIVASFVIRRCAGKDSTNEAADIPSRRFPVEIVLVLILVALPAILVKSWDYRNQYGDISGVFKKASITEGVVNVFDSVCLKVPLSDWPSAVWSKQEQKRLKEAFKESMTPAQYLSITKKRRTAFTALPLSGCDSTEDIPPLHFFPASQSLLLIACCYCILSFSPLLSGFRLRLLLLFFVTLVGFFLYLTIIHLVYLFCFGDYDCARLASYPRYVGTYIHGWLLLVIGLSAFLWQKRSQQNQFDMPAWTIATNLTLLFLMHASPNAILEHLWQAGNISVTSPIRSAIASDKNNMDDMKNIWLIHQGDYGFSHYVSRYLFAPTSHFPSTQNWSLGPLYHDPDLWTANLTAAEWATRLCQEKYEGVYLFKTDDQFWELYAGLFENGEESRNDDCRLYRVVTIEDDKVKLVPVSSRP